MDAKRWQAVERVLDVALASDPSQWPAIISERCSGDPELQEEVESLLRQMGATTRFLEAPAAAIAAAILAEKQESSAADAYVGRRVGTWLLTRLVGRGGMARVYAAERADGQYTQLAAFKLLRPGLDSEIDHARFRRERQILASLNHPGIARLLDGGVTEDATPYLVMEHIDGQPIDEYAREQQLTIRQRIELFLRALEATQYAHANLIVHRDLKPSNLLVTREGSVKLLDFGLARLVDPEGSAADGTAHTEQRWMTPEYAAPEQIRGEPATTLTDVYQLGVILFELLTGSLPFGRRLAGVRALEDAILGDEPPLASKAGARAALAGDLDAIIFTALQKRAERRYASVFEFAEDLRRHLSGHPVHARRQTSLYRARRFVGRNRLAVAAGLLLAVSAGVYVSTILAERDRVRRALAEARLGTQRAEQVTNFMMGLFEASEGGRALTDTVTARALLSRALAEARELSAQPEMQAQMLDVIGRLHTELGNNTQARPLLEEALQIRRRLYGSEHPDVATTMENLAAAVDQRDVNETVRLRREALDLRRRVSGPRDPRTVSAVHELAQALHQAGQVEAADPLFDEWLALIEQVPERSAQRAREHTAAAAIFIMRGDNARGEQLHRQALELRRAAFGPEHHLVASSMVDLALVLNGQRRFEEAAQLLGEAAASLRRSFPDGHPVLASALNFHGLVLSRLQRHDEAIPFLHEAIEINRRLDGPNTIAIANIAMTLADALTQVGDATEAERVGRDAVRIYAAELGPQNSMVLFAQAHVGDALRAQGKFAEAEPLLLESYRRFEVPRPITARWHRYTLACLVRLYEDQRRTAEAAHYRELLDAAIQSAVSAPASAAAPH